MGARTKPTRKSKTNSSCHVEGCTRAIGHPASGLCKPCYSFFYYWAQKSPTELMRRKRTLSFWGSRIEQLHPTKLRRVK